MKVLFKIAAYCCGGIMGAAAGAWSAGWCSGTAFAIIVIGMACGLFVAVRELAVINEYERKEKEAVRRSAWKAEFMREVDKPV